MSRSPFAARARALVAVTCTLTVLPALADPVNLIVNGDFEAGFSGFSTDYRQSASGCIGCVGVAASTTGWYNAPGYVHPFNDHSSGSGLMLQWDPPSTNNTTARIWAQSVGVQAGTTYTFSGWVREANSEATPNNGRVGVYVDGQLLGTQDALDHVWTQWSFNWTATQAGTVQLALRDLYPFTWNGSYSAMDDLHFGVAGGSAPTAGVPEPSTLALLALGLAGLAGRRRARRCG